MAITIVIVALIGLVALAVIGVIVFLEVRPLLEEMLREAFRPSPGRTRAAREMPIPLHMRAQLAKTRRRRDASGVIATLLMGMALLAVGFWEWSNFSFRGEWLSTEGSIVESQPEPPAPESGNSRALIRYTYRIGDDLFTGTWIDEARQTTPGALAVRYLPGQPLTVWYHPLLPTFPSLGRVTLWYVALAFAAGVFLLLTSAVRLMRKVIIK